MVNPSAPPRGVPSLSAFPAASAAARTRLRLRDRRTSVHARFTAPNASNIASTASSNSSANAMQSIFSRTRRAWAIFARNRSGGVSADSSRGNVPDARIRENASTSSDVGAQLASASSASRSSAPDAFPEATWPASSAGVPGRRWRTMATLFARCVETSVGAPGGFLRPPTFFPDASDVVSDAAPPPEGALFAAFLGVAANASFSAVACAGLSRGGAKGGGGARARARAPPVVDERYPPPPSSSSETSDASDASETFAKAPFSFRDASSFASFATSSHHVPCARVTLSQNTFRRPLLAGRRGGKPPR